MTSSENTRVDQDSEMLPVRASTLTQAILRISDELDTEIVAQTVADSALSLADAQYCVVALLNLSGEFNDMFVSGLTHESEQALRSETGRIASYRDLDNLRTSLRDRSFASCSGTRLPEGRTPVGSPMEAQIRVEDKHLGTIFVCEESGGGEFTREDQEILSVFARQAAVVIMNACRYGDEQREKTHLRALVTASPVGMLVVDAKTGTFLLSNREARRIVRGLEVSGNNLKQLREMVSFSDVNGKDIPHGELPSTRAISGEAVRSEQVVFHLPGGYSVTTLASARPIRSKDGGIAYAVILIQDLTPIEKVRQQWAELIGVVSHDLRTPLSNIKSLTAGALSTMSEQDIDETRELFRLIDQQTDRMRDLLNRLLDMSR